MLLQHGPELVDVEVDGWAGSTVWIDGTALGFNFIIIACTFQPHTMCHQITGIILFYTEVSTT